MILSLILQKNDLKIFDNVFFNEIEIQFILSRDIKHVKGMSSNNIDLEKRNFSERYNYDFNNNALNKINIKIEANSNINESYTDIRMRICHELNHLYTYWNIIQDDFKEHSDDFKNNIVPEEYDNLLHKWTNNVYAKMIEKITPKNYKDINESICYLLIYSLTRFERNAFLCEISAFLFDKRNAMKNVKSVENELKNCKPYKLYTEEFYTIYDKIKNEWTDDQKKILANTYNKIYNTNKSFNKILKILKEKNDDTVLKIQDNIHELIVKYKDVPMYTSSYPFESEISFENPMYKFNFF